MAVRLTSDRPSIQRTRLAEALLRQRAVAGPSGPAPRDPSAPIPLSFSQLRMWFLQQWQPEAPTLNAARAVRLRGELDADALRRALDTVVDRHESLRTVFVSDGPGEPRQVVRDHAGIDLALVDLSAAEQPEDELDARMRELAREPFDLAADAMLRTTLIRLDERDHVLLLRMHHIAGDAVSMAVMFAEISASYDAFRAGLPNPLTTAPTQFGDVAVWQRNRLQGRLLADLTAYWVGQLEGAPALLDLPLDRPRPEIQRHEGAHRHFALPAATAAGIDALAREERATRYMVTLAAFASLLYRLSGQDDVVLGTPMANRTHSELAGVVGFLSNTVALRVRLDGNPSFREVLRRTRAVTLGGLAHAEMPFEQIVGALRLARDAGHNPLFQVNFRAQAPLPVPEMAGLTATPVAVDIGYSRFDLALELRCSDEEVSGYFEYDLELFDPATVDTIVEALDALLAQVLADPDTEVLAIALPAISRRPRRAHPSRPTRGRRPAQPRGGPS
jgi:hypothetical protein